MAKQKPMRKKIESPFCKNLSSILAERGISQKAAAAMAEVTPATMSDWVSGNSLPHDHLKIEKLCRALSCDFQWLLTGIHSRVDLQNVSLAELFEGEDDPMFSGVFEISARRLRRKKQE
ncbi:MAG: helix-turn-helix domain-containing protein [Bdellovibrionales bacterium]|nr:helix-turn-helix domain-containing protein [Bdellovibrionales bacterium]